MGILDDSDSEADDDSTSSEEDVKTPSGKPKVDVSQFMNKKKASLDDYEVFKGVDEEEDETAKKFKEILQLREALGMDRDVKFLAEQAVAEEEKKRLASMTQEERMAEDRAKSGDMMARIKAKQEELARKKAEEAAKQAEAGDDDDKEVEVKKKKKEKKEKKKKKSSD